MNALNSWPLRIAGLVALAALVAVAAWWFFIRSDASLAEDPLDFAAEEQDEPGAGGEGGDDDAAGDDDATGADDESVATASDGYQGYTIVDEHPSVDGTTQASYFADETLASVGVPSTAQGITPDVSGQFFLGPDGLDPEAPSVIVVGLEALESDADRRDGRVREALEVNQYPEATFTASSIAGWPGEIPDGGDVEVQLLGTLELHGVERDVTWDVEARRQGDVISALATTNFLYEDFDIPVLNISGFVSVEEDVTLQVQLIAESQQS